MTVVPAPGVLEIRRPYSSPNMCRSFKYRFCRPMPPACSLPVCLPGSTDANWTTSHRSYSIPAPLSMMCRLNTPSNSSPQTSCLPPVSAISGSSPCSAAFSINGCKIIFGKRISSHPSMLMPTDTLPCSRTWIMVR